jgi:hypothetical protein
VKIDHIQIASEGDLEWLRNGPDPSQVEEQSQQEVEKALAATGTPSQWRPVDVDESLLR